MPVNITSLILPFGIVILDGKTQPATRKNKEKNP